MFKKKQKTYYSNVKGRSGQVTNPFELDITDGFGNICEFYKTNDGVQKKLSLDEFRFERECWEKKRDNKRGALSSGNNFTSIQSNKPRIQILATGCNSTITTTGQEAQIVSTGSSAVIGVNGDCSHVISKGSDSCVSSNGNEVLINSMGTNSRVSSIGDIVEIIAKNSFLQLASCGNGATIKANGDYAQIGSSGDEAIIEATGVKNVLASSGYRSQISVLGEKSVLFSCGSEDTIKAINGTWISLCEYDKDIDGFLTPIFAASAQIGNENYRDCNGDVLSDDNYYRLIDKQFSPILHIDGINVIKRHSKMYGDIKVIKCKTLDKCMDLFCVIQRENAAHGKTLKIAMNNLEFKKITQKRYI